MARKTYSIIIAVVALMVVFLLVFEVERIYNQQKIKQTEKLFRQRFSLSEREKVAVCNYQNNWQVVSALERLWLVNDKQIYKTDVDNQGDDAFKNIPRQPLSSPLIDYYHLYQSCLW